MRFEGHTAWPPGCRLVLLRRSAEIEQNARCEYPRAFSREAIVENCNCNHRNRSTNAQADVNRLQTGRAAARRPAEAPRSPGSRAAERPGPILIPVGATVLFTFVPGASGCSPACITGACCIKRVADAPGPSGVLRGILPRTLLGWGATRPTPWTGRGTTAEQTRCRAVSLVRLETGPARRGSFR